jgi:hypothetical protein
MGVYTWLIIPTTVETRIVRISIRMVHKNDNDRVLPASLDKH